MSSQYMRLANIRDYWMPRDPTARAEVRVSDIDDILRALVQATTDAAERKATIAKLVGAIDMIRETLDGGNVEDLRLIINDALRAALEGEE